MRLSQYKVQLKETKQEKQLEINSLNLKQITQMKNLKPKR